MESYQIAHINRLIKKIY